MPYDSNGNWTPENDSTSGKLTGLLSSNNAYMKQAETVGKQAAQQRGLLNSSMGIQSAEAARIAAAAPLAAQDAQQTHQKNLANMDLGSKERIAGLNVGAHDRQYAISGAVEAQKTYGAMLNEVIKNDSLSTEARNNYQTHFAAQLNEQMSLIEQLYNIDLDWTSPVVQA